MSRSLDELKGSWDERQQVISWHLRSYWRDRHHLVLAYRRGCRDDAQAVLHDLRQWWRPVENRVFTVRGYRGCRSPRSPHQSHLACLSP